MAIDYYRFNFSSGKFKSYFLAELVRDLAINFNFCRAVHDEKEKRRGLLRLVWRQSGQKIKIKKQEANFIPCFLFG